MIILLVIIFQKRKLPFTRVREMQQKGTNSLFAIFSMILMFIIGGIVYATSFVPGWITVLICGLVAGIIVLIFRFIRKSWISA
jgi:predicted membrane metal-binding protein